MKPTTQTKPRRRRARTPKVTLDLSTWATEVGAREIERYTREGGREMITYAIETKAGPLHVTPFPWDPESSQGGAWIACRFEDVDAARRVFGVTRLGTGARLNPYSGKWNFMEGLGADQNGVDYMVLVFRSEVGAILGGK